MQMDSRNTVEALRTLLSGLPNVIVSQAEIVLSTGVKIQMGNGHPVQHCDEQSSEPEPCPFCGKKAHIVQNSRGHGYYIGCRTYIGELGSPCPGSIAYQSSRFCYVTEQLAIEVWNRRATTKRSGNKKGD